MPGVTIYNELCLLLASYMKMFLLQNWFEHHLWQKQHMCQEKTENWDEKWEYFLDCKMNEKGNTQQNRPGEWEIPGEECIEPSGLDIPWLNVVHGPSSTPTETLGDSFHYHSWCWISGPFFFCPGPTALAPCCFLWPLTEPMHHTKVIKYLSNKEVWKCSI